MRSLFGPIALTLLLLPAWPAHGGELETLRAENAQLRARVDELEKELGKAKAAAPLAAAVARRAESAIHVDTSDERQVVSTDAMRIDASGGIQTRHWITLRGRRAAGADGSAATMELVVDAAASDGVYRGTETLLLAIDGQEVTVPVTRFDSFAAAPSRGAGATRRADDRMVATLPRDVFERIANATSVTTRARTTVLTWAPDHIAAARALRDRLAR